VNGRLVGWIVLVSALAATAYGARAASGKPDADVLYHYSTAVSGLVQYALISLVIGFIARGATGLLAFRAPRHLGVAAVAAVGVLVSTYIVAALVDLYSNPGKEQGLTPSRWEPSHAGAFAVNFVVVVGVAPVVEELLFRGLGYSLLERYGRWLAIVMVGISFGLVHGLIEGFPVLAFFGAALAWLRSRTDSVLPGIGTHAAFNAIALIAAVTT
jgi:membrane protease YdiL (CAAX protease family)